MKIRLHKLIQEPFVVFSAGSIPRHALTKLLRLIKSGKVMILFALQDLEIKKHYT